MKVIDFVTMIKNNKVEISKNLSFKLDKERVRVKVLFEQDGDEDKLFEQAAQEHFLNGFSETDTIYDSN